MPRERAYSDPLTPPLRPTRRPPAYDSSSNPASTLTAESLARLSHVGSALSSFDGGDRYA